MFIVDIFLYRFCCDVKKTVAKLRYGNIYVILTML